MAWDFQAAIDGLRIPTYACPSDPKAYRERDPGGGKVKLWPTTYGFNLGTWFVFDPASRQGGDGVFYPNSHLGLNAILDGTTHTILAAEVKAWTPYLRNGGPSTTSRPDTVEQARAIVASGAQFKSTGHTEWPDGRVHHSGFTATLPPNSVVPFEHAGTLVDADFNSWQEGRDGSDGNPTFAIITSRSHHPGCVQAVMLDGSIRTIDESIELVTWRSLATRSGYEVTQ
jgi:hypothetical protein